MLTLGPGSVINGLVLGNGTDTFQLGGTGKDTFNLSLIGAGQQYDGFSTFNKVDSSNWTVTGTGAQDWNVLGGTLSVNGVINGLVTVNAGGTLGGNGTSATAHQWRHAGAGQFVRPLTVEGTSVHGGRQLSGRGLGRDQRAHQRHGYCHARQCHCRGVPAGTVTQAIHDPQRCRRAGRHVQCAGLSNIAEFQDA